VQASSPEPESEPLAVAATGWLYQPFASGGRASATLTEGAVASYCSEKLALELFPALSPQLPETLVPAVSGPL
jgi:hypothetical protein